MALPSQLMLTEPPTDEMKTRFTQTNLTTKRKGRSDGIFIGCLDCAEVKKGDCELI